MVRVHLDGNNWNLTSIANAIWQFEASNIYKSFTFPFQGIWQWLLVKQHKVHTPQRKKMSLNYKVWFLFPNTSKSCCQINGGNQLGHLTHEILKLQLLEKNVVSMTLLFGALEYSLKQFTKLGEGSHVLVSGDFGPLSELVYDLGNIVELDTR